MIEVPGRTECGLRIQAPVGACVEVKYGRDFEDDVDDGWLYVTVTALPHGTR